MVVRGHQYFIIPNLLAHVMLALYFIDMNLIKGGHFFNGIPIKYEPIDWDLLVGLDFFLSIIKSTLFLSQVQNHRATILSLCLVLLLTLHPTLISSCNSRKTN